MSDISHCEHSEAIFGSSRVTRSLHRLCLLVMTLASMSLLSACGGTADGFFCDEITGFCKLPQGNDQNNNDDDDEEEQMTEEEMEAARQARLRAFFVRSQSSRKEFQLAPHSRIPNY